MALHIAVVMVEGDHTSRLAGILGEFGYTEAGPRSTYDGINAASTAITTAKPGDRRIPRFMSCSSQGWTLLFDGEMTLFADEKACSNLSTKLASRVFTMICEGVSNTYGYYLFKDGAKVRGFFSVGGEISEDVGTRLGAESAFDRRKVFDNDMLAVMKSLGVDYTQVIRTRPFSVVEAKLARPVPELTPEQRAAIAEEAKKLVASVTVVRGFGTYSKESRQQARVEAAGKEKKKGWKLWRK